MEKKVKWQLDRITQVTEPGWLSDRREHLNKMLLKLY